MADDSDFIGFLRHQISKEDDNNLLGEFLLLGNNVLADEISQKQVIRLVTGMAMASMELCKEFDEDGYLGFLQGFSEVIESEIERVRGMSEFPIIN